jgi:hypothetical protein
MTEGKYHVLPAALRDQVSRPAESLVQTGGALNRTSGCEQACAICLDKLGHASVRRSGSMVLADTSVIQAAGSA